ncbi:lymphocyte cytosolic protein 2 isoform X2 [Osmerus mordax]|uniref:lymphocyte cytosolic protein 2 isoform X2 n=1 Tax=Osmerus mordax TaxID=8014 RepID=UPI00350EDCFC
MSLESIPSRSEVQVWSAHSLADYMNKLKLSGCDKVVMRNNITGERFLEMIENDLQKFPSKHIPIITRICTEINKREEKRGFGRRPTEHKYNQQDFVQEEIWGREEFDDSDNDYETAEENYVCPLSEEPGGGQDNSDEDYEQPPSENREDIPRARILAQPLGNDGYIDCVKAGRAPRPPQRPEGAAPSRAARPTPPRANAAPQRPFPKAGPAPPGPAVPQVDRSRKPCVAGALRTDLPISNGSPFGFPHPGASLSAQLMAPKPPDMRAAIGRSTPGLPALPPPALPPPALPLPALPPPALPSSQHNVPQAGPSTGMDPRWYGGQMSRQHAEMLLRRINQDGAFLVRDSSRGLSQQPYTLMVLFLDKVYNIQIRQEGGQYSLGTGLNGFQSLPTVGEIIGQHAQTPLILINAMERESSAQRQSCLLYPAGR